ncbi:MAG: tetratricopeptide repeat protein [Streptosporangiales bacterium]|nr:tetratricopeptide repeat protein [Streptosporangiales bacterium]
MELRLLGPPELAVGGQTVDIGPPRSRIVLAVLALHTGRVTPIERLIEAVWDTSPPATARAQIQICVSAIRRVLQDAGLATTVHTRPPGYLLDLGGTVLDLERFAELVVQARAHADGGDLDEASATLRTADALWRGPAFAGVNSALVQRAALTLEDDRLTAVEERVRLDLALGRHQDVVGELRDLVDRQPLREALYGALMLALYRSGRQAEALAVFRQARTTLVDEVGIEPGPDLQRLEAAVLARDPALDLAPSTAAARGRPTGDAEPAAPPAGGTSDRPWVAVPRLLPASVADFTGRGQHLREIRESLGGDGADGAYAVRIVAIGGRGGVGKTSLAIRAGHELADAFPDGQLYADLRETNIDDRSAKVLTRFLRALGFSGLQVPNDPQERAELYRTTLADRRVLVILDGVTAEDQVVPLLPGGPGCAVITTSRRRLSGLPGARLVDVDVFDTDHSIELLARTVGKERIVAEGDSAAELATFCEGLPLALRIAGARLASRPHWRIAHLVARLADEARRLDELAHHGLELRSNIALSVQELSDDAQRLFRLFALVQAPDAPSWTAAALLDTDLESGVEVLESLVDANLVTAVDFPDSRGQRYRYHDLVRVYAAERLASTESAAEREAALARLLGGWLALAEEAHRKDYGGDFTILHGSAPRWRPPDGVAAAHIDDPYEWFEVERRALVAAVRQSAAAGMDELSWDLALVLVTLCEVRGYYDDWRDTSRIALEVTERHGNRRGRAAMLYSLGSLGSHIRSTDEGIAYIAEAVEAFRALGDAHGTGLALRNLTSLRRWRGDGEHLRSPALEAVELLREVGDRVGEASALTILAHVEIEYGDPDLAWDMLDRSQALKGGYRRGSVQSRHVLAYLQRNSGDYDAARKSDQEVLTVVRELDDHRGEAFALLGLGRIELAAGNLADAERFVREARAVAGSINERGILSDAERALGEIALLTGDVDTGIARLEEAARMFAASGAVRTVASIEQTLADLRATRADQRE